MNVAQPYLGRVPVLVAVVWAMVAPAVAADRAGPMALDPATLRPPKTYPADGFKADGVTAAFFDGLPWQGKPTRVFAWYGVPRVEAGAKVPAMVLVHGGGGTAFAGWVKAWVDRGYAAIAVDTCGQVPEGSYGKWKRHEHGGPPGWGGLSAVQVDLPPADQWTYHAVGAVALGHSLLRSLPGVDADRVGITGVSWGGYLTCISAGVDGRYKLAVPVYGCGFLGDNSTWLGAFRKLGPERAGRWLGMWDPSRYLPNANVPMLWVSGTNDFAYPMDSLQKSYRLPPGPRTLCVKVRMPHGHGPVSEQVPEALAFADGALRDGTPLTKVIAQGSGDGKAWATYDARSKIAKAELAYTTDAGEWQKRDWKTRPAAVDAEERKVSADLPDGATVFYLNLVDDRGLTVSTEHVERGAKAPSTAAARKPNVIVILADDLGYADVGAQGRAPDVRTPNLDGLAAEGVRCTAGYITAPQCSPSRAGLLTGRYQQRFGLDTIPDNPLPLAEVTLAERLKPAGYISGMVGKWHLDPNPKSERWIRENLPPQPAGKKNREVPIPEAARRTYSPAGQGFDEFFKGEIDRYWANYDLTGRDLAHDGEWVATRDRYRIDAQSDAAVAFVDRHKAEPFFLYLCYYAPHTPLAAAKPYLDRFPGAMPERRRYALAMTAAMDDGVGRILAALRKHKIDDQTLVVFTSDNGAPLKLTKPDTAPVDGDLGGWDGSLNDPWVGEKGMLSEGGVRVPFLLWRPGTLPAGRAYDEPVSALDVAATAAAAAGLPPDPALDGVDLTPHLRGERPGPPHDALYWRFWNQAAVRAGRWKYLRAGNEREFLFDLGSDAHERRNVLADHPAEAGRLRAKLEAWTREIQPPGLPDKPLNAQERRWYEFHFPSGGGA